MADVIRSPDGKYIWDFEKKDWKIDDNIHDTVNIDISDSVVSGDVKTNVITIINNPDDIANAIAKVLRGEAKFENEAEIDAYNIIHKETEEMELCCEEESNLAKSAFQLGKYDDFAFHVFKAIEIGKQSENKYDYYAGGLVAFMYEEFGNMMAEAELYDAATELYEDALDTVRENPTDVTFNHKKGYMLDLCHAVFNSGDHERFWKLIENYVEHCKYTAKWSTAVIWGLILAALKAEKIFGADDNRTKSYFKRAIKEMDYSPYHRFDIDFLKINGWPDILTERGYVQNSGFSKEADSRIVSKPSASTKKSKNYDVERTKSNLTKDDIILYLVLIISGSGALLYLL